jgi:hypothetical protein
VKILIAVLSLLISTTTVFAAESKFDVSRTINMKTCNIISEEDNFGILGSEEFGKVTVTCDGQKIYESDWSLIDNVGDEQEKILLELINSGFKNSALPESEKTTGPFFRKVNGLSIGPGVYYLNFNLTRD